MGKKITREMFLAYETCLIDDFMRKNGQLYFMRSCSDFEAENILNKDCSCGSDGSLHKNAQHTNDHLEDGKDYLFSSLITSLEDIAKARVCIQALQFSQDQMSGKGDQTRSIVVFSMDPNKAKGYLHKGYYGVTWSDFKLWEAHIPVTQENMNSLNMKGILPDFQTYVDGYYFTNDLEEIIDRQQEAGLDKADLLNLANFEKYTRENPKYHQALRYVKGAMQKYYQDSKDFEEDESAVYDREDDVEDEKQSSGMSIVDFDRNTDEEMLIETIESILYDSGYSAAIKKATFAEYIRTLPDGPAMAQLLETKYNYSIPGLTDIYITAEIKVEDEVNIFDSQSSSTTESTQDATTTSTSEQDQDPVQ